MEESKRITISIRFIDWFINRGKNYEHNINIIDKHLKDLLYTNDKSAKLHTYYLPGNQVNVQSQAVLEEQVKYQEEGRFGANSIGIQGGIRTGIIGSGSGGRGASGKEGRLDDDFILSY